MSGYWINQDGSKGERLCSRAAAKLSPLKLETAVWTVKQWFENGTTTLLAIRVDREDINAVDALDDRASCLRYLLRLMQSPPYYGALIEGETDRNLRRLKDGVEQAAIVSSLPLVTELELHDTPIVIHPLLQA